MDSVTEIKSRLSIVDVVSQYCQLKKAGRNFKACCPFHSEKTPSFIISPERQFAWCYGCQTGGDIFKIVQLLEGVDFKESLKILAEKAGVELPANFGGGVQKEKKEKLIEINEETRDFFVAELVKNSAAQKYLKERGLKSETIEEWGIGFAPAGFENLFPQLEEKFSKKEIVEAGVAGLKEFGGDKLFDKFRDRLMFPIEDHRGRVVAFTGRVLDSSEPKYLNSAESPIFTKGAILFGFAKAREAMRESKFAVIVEGQMDVISAYQHGFKNVVASSGTALTEMHLKALKNLVERVVIFLDGDAAGNESSKRALGLLSLKDSGRRTKGDEDYSDKVALEFFAKSDLEVKIAILPNKFKDPDQAIREDPKFFEEAVYNAIPPLDFFFGRYFKGKDLNDIHQKKKVAHQLMDYAQKMVNFIEREDFIKKVSSKLDISKETLIEEMDSIPQDFLSEVKESETHSEKIETADLLVGLILAFPKIAAEISELKNLKIESEIWQKLKTADFREISEVGEVGEKLAVLVSDKYSDFGDAKIKTEILKLIGKLNSELVEIKKRELKIAMQKAEEAGDEKKAAELFEKYQKLLAK